MLCLKQQRQQKNQRERQGDLSRRHKQTRQKRDAEAHQSARRDPLRRQLEQQRNTAAR